MLWPYCDKLYDFFHQNSSRICIWLWLHNLKRRKFGFIPLHNRTIVQHYNRNSKLAEGFEFLCMKKIKNPLEVANGIFPFMSLLRSNVKDKKPFCALLNVNLVFSENPFFSDSFDFFDYVSNLLDPPTHHVSKRKHLAIPTNPLFCLRNTWMVP